MYGYSVAFADSVLDETVKHERRSVRQSFIILRSAVVLKKSTFRESGKYVDTRSRFEESGMKTPYPCVLYSIGIAAYDQSCRIP